jgi:AcrR family transcriptional regulator
MIDYGLNMERSLVGSSPRRQRRKAEVRQKIYEAAMKLFRAQGYESTTVQDICDVADTAKQTFFNYFPTKDYLLAEYHTNLVRGIFEEISELPASLHVEAIVSAMRIFAAGAEKSATLSRTILRHVFSSDVLERNDRVNEEKIFHWFHHHLHKAIRTGELASGLNSQVLTSVIMCLLSSTVQEWIGSPTTLDLEKELVQRTRFVLRLAKRRTSK